MYEVKELYRQMDIDDDVYAYSLDKLNGLKERFEAIDENAEYNQLKVLKAFRECRVSDACFTSSSGYGYNDLGRDTLEEVYSHIFHTEDALVRPQITCGTHALNVALSSNLRLSFISLSLHISARSPLGKDTRIFFNTPSV